MAKLIMVSQREKHQYLDYENLKLRAHLLDLGVDGNIILKYISKREYKSVDWINLVQDRNIYIYIYIWGHAVA
jgi:hypothetical protein